MNILVVDDEGEYRVLVGGFLKDQGWTVFLAGDVTSVLVPNGLVLVAMAAGLFAVLARVTSVRLE